MKLMPLDISLWLSSSRLLGCLLEGIVLRSSSPSKNVKLRNRQTLHYLVEVPRNRTCTPQREFEWYEYSHN